MASLISRIFRKLKPKPVPVCSACGQPDSFIGLEGSYSPLGWCEKCLNVGLAISLEHMGDSTIISLQDLYDMVHQVGGTFGKSN